jgi:hypothetical protein
VYNVSVNLRPDQSYRLDADQRSDTKRLPSKPTSQMLALGAQAGGVSADVAWRIYRAMIEAAAGEAPGSGRIHDV